MEGEPLVGSSLRARIRMPTLKAMSFPLLRHSRKKAFSSPENLQRWIAAARKTEDYQPPPSLRSRLDVATRTRGRLSRLRDRAQGR